MMGEKEIQIRCKACSSRFSVLPLEGTAQCPQCHQEWKIKWLDSHLGMIIAPVSWKEYQSKSRRILPNE
jgi:Zn finger protein HypA/HybF involved in hydrogenase expression